ncbi:hypothetical protein MB02_05760 [Croceicoccus estronivorus]|uniref:YbaN family protein n=1 Tax=Croceicoccus estronivorus TaxID=1172626 RepID=UPI00082CACDD|nr:YbaN family protein [Croceicoccus estronivorus]OCC24948.1 hypothetical protein MB02_05760 [Croceicoccus estronivorus]
MQRVYLMAGLASLGLGIIGIFLPIMPTVPFLILAAWCFGKSNPTLERRLLEHPRYGPHILLWREKRAIARIGKLGATFAFAASVLLAFVFMAWPWPLVPCAIAVVMLSWIWSRPDC